MSDKVKANAKELQKLLKAAKTALHNEEYDDCIPTAKSALKLDKNNFYAFLFLGKSLQAKQRNDEALKAYIKATESNTEHEYGWKGQLSLRLESPEFIPFFETALGFAKLLGAKKEQFTEVIEYIKSYVVKHDIQTTEFKQYYLKQIIPGLSELGDIIGYQMNDPSTSLKQLIKIIEDDESKKLKRADEKTKMTLTVNMTERAKLDKLNEQRWKIISLSEIPQLYEILIDLENNDESRYKAQDVYLKYKYNMLIIAPSQLKDSLRDDVKDIVDGMILIRCPSKLAWNIHFEWSDPHMFSDLHLEDICQYIKLFGKNNDYGMVLYNFLISEICPFEQSKVVEYLTSKKKRNTPNKINADTGRIGKEEVISVNEDAHENEKNEQVDDQFEIFNIEPQQVLTNLIKGADSTKNSVLCYRLVLDYSVHMKDFILGLEISAKLSKAVFGLRANIGLNLPHTKVAHTLNLATIYTYYEAPKNFFKALELYQSIENKEPDNTRIKIGQALILVETKRFSEASAIIETLLTRNNNDISALQEYGWCQIQLGNFDKGREYLEKAVALLQDESNNIIKGAHLVEMLSTVTYRQALSYYIEIELNEESMNQTTLKSYVNKCSSFILNCLKLSPNYAPAFTTLGLLYYNYLGNKDRAIQIFNKAFQLDPAEIEASYKLAEHFTSINDWEMAELICTGVIENDRARRQLTSTFNKIQDNSWPYRIMGCAAMELKNDVKAIEFFQTSLRLNPTEVTSWIGLGEAYMSRGRIEASIKVFSHVIRLQAGIKDMNAEITTEMEDKAGWHAVYLLATSLTNMMEFNKSIKILTNLLSTKEDARKNLCVSLILIETMILRCKAEIRKGAILRASDTLKQIFECLFSAFELESHSFKLWKLFSDTLSISLKIQSSLPDLPVQKMLSLTHKLISAKNDLWEEIDFSEFSVSRLQKEERFATIGHLFLVLSCIGGFFCSKPSDIKAVRSSVTYNIAISFLLWFKQSNDERFRDLSIKILNKTIALEPENSDYWNCLGIISMSKNSKIAQHCFIRALSIESKSSSSWFNLGMLYIKHKDFELANECFTRTQSLSPSSPIPWTGLAVLNSETGKIQEAKNLFTHSYVLSKGAIPENTLLYAVSVLDTVILDGSEERDLIAVQQLSTVSHGMINYMKIYSHDFYALELTINIIERLHSFDKGIEYSEKLCSLLEAKYEEDEAEGTLISYCKAKSQLSRFLLANKKFDQARELCEEVGNLLESVESLTIIVQKCLLSCFTVQGLSLYFQGKFDESLGEFKKLLDAFPENQRIVILISQVLHASGDAEAKQAAMDELLGITESQGTSLLISMTIAAIALVEDWEDYIIAVKEVLDQLDLNMLINDTYREIPSLLSMISAKIKNISSREDKIWQRNAFLFPGDSTSWRHLNEEVSLELSICSSQESAVAVSEAYVNVERLREVQRGILFSGGISEKGLALLLSPTV